MSNSPVFLEFEVTDMPKSVISDLDWKVFLVDFKEYFQKIKMLHMGYTFTKATRFKRLKHVQMYCT